MKHATKSAVLLRTCLSFMQWSNFLLGSLRIKQIVTPVCSHLMTELLQSVKTERLLLCHYPQLFLHMTRIITVNTVRILKLATKKANRSITQ